MLLGEADPAFYRPEKTNGLREFLSGRRVSRLKNPLGIGAEHFPQHSRWWRGRSCEYEANLAFNGSSFRLDTRTSWDIVLAIKAVRGQPFFCQSGWRKVGPIPTKSHPVEAKSVPGRAVADLGRKGAPRSSLEVPHFYYRSRGPQGVLHRRRSAPRRPVPEALHARGLRVAVRPGQGRGRQVGRFAPVPSHLRRPFRVRAHGQPVAVRRAAEARRLRRTRARGGHGRHERLARDLGPRGAQGPVRGIAREVRSAAVGGL